MSTLESIGNRKIGNGLVHPVGPKQVSETLEGIPQFQELTIFYKDKIGESIGEKSPGWRNKQLKGNSKDFLVFQTLIDVNYNGIRDNWTLNMSPIPAENSLEFKKFITEIALPNIKEWLSEKRAETWFEGYRHYIVGTDKHISEYCVFETHGERVVRKARFKNSA